jgi:hypothetical protein
MRSGNKRSDSCPPGEESALLVNSNCNGVVKKRIKVAKWVATAFVRVHILVPVVTIAELPALVVPMTTMPHDLWWTTCVVRVSLVK